MRLMLAAVARLVTVAAHATDAARLQSATRFRPVVENKTDISIFTEMLKPKLVDA